MLEGGGDLGFGGVAAPFDGLRAIGTQSTQKGESEYFPQRRQDAKFGFVVISTEGRNPSLDPSHLIEMTGLARHFASLREILFSHMSAVVIDAPPFDDRLPIRIQARHSIEVHCENDS